MHSYRDIKFTASQTTSKLTAGKVCYQGQVIHNHTLDEAETRKRIANSTPGASATDPPTCPRSYPAECGGAVTIAEGFEITTIVNVWIGLKINVTDKKLNFIRLGCKLFNVEKRSARRLSLCGEGFICKVMVYGRNAEGRFAQPSIFASIVNIWAKKGILRMKQVAFGVGVVALFAGCAFNPETMPVGQKDSDVYVDKGAPQSLATKEAKAKVAVITSVGEYKDYKQMAEALDSSLNAKLSGFSFFEVVDRKSQAALIKDSVASGTDTADISVSGVEADFVVIARIASLTVQPTTSLTSTGGGYSFQVVFDFKWISKATQRVVMTESFKPPTRSANSQVDLIAALNRAAEIAARDFCAKIATKYAPPARVLQTRGDGAVARISLGKNYGVGEGTKVCFYEIIDNSDVGGEKRDMNDIATGEVKRVEEKYSWVAVDNADKTNVRKGVYVRVLEQQKGIGSSLLESSGFGETFESK